MNDQQSTSPPTITRFFVAERTSYEVRRDPDDGTEYSVEGAPFWEVCDLYKQGYASYHLAQFDTREEADRFLDGLTWADCECGYCRVVAQAGATC